MFSIFSQEVFAPLYRRIGTASASALVAIGVQTEPANQIALGVVAALGILHDLALSHIMRKAGKT